MFCPKCGALNDARGGYCVNCGYDFGLIPTHIKERAANADKADTARNTVAECTTENGADAADKGENFGGYYAAGESQSIEANAQDTPKTAAQVSSAGMNSISGASVGAKQPRCVENKKPIQTYMMRAILLTVFGSIAFGILSVIFSGMTQTELAVGSMNKAREYSEKTRMFCWISLFIGIVKYLYIGLFFLLYLIF